MKTFRADSLTFTLPPTIMTPKGFRPIDAPMLDLTFMDEAMNSMANDFVAKQDEILLAALRKHIPDVTKINIHQYSSRLTVVRKDKEYPQELWLDFGKKDAIHVLTLHKPEFSMPVVDGEVYGANYHQNYEVK